MTLPANVAKAIVAVMSDVPKLAKGEKNSHGNYNFASIDDFLEAVRPLCAKHGLIIAQNEESFEMKDGWLIMTFSFTLAHSSGEVWDDRQNRTIMVSSKMGAQAFGAAQSYALKQYMRALFQIATGEKGMDADEHPNATLPDVEREKTTKDPDWQGPLNKTGLKAALRELHRDIEGVSDQDELDALLAERKDVLNQGLADLPMWVEGDGGDKRGINGAIDDARQRISDKISFAA